MNDPEVIDWLATGEGQSWLNRRFRQVQHALQWIDDDTVVFRFAWTKSCSAEAETGGSTDWSPREMEIGDSEGAFIYGGTVPRIPADYVMPSHP